MNHIPLLEKALEQTLGMRDAHKWGAWALTVVILLSMYQEYVQADAIRADMRTHRDELSKKISNFDNELNLFRTGLESFILVKNQLDGEQNERRSTLEEQTGKLEKSQEETKKELEKLKESLKKEAKKTPTQQ